MNGINTYLTFNGNCREAVTFYAKCLGAELQLMTFADAPMESPPDLREKVMHAAVRKGTHVVMASDSAPGATVQVGDNFHICIQCESAEEIDRLFKALSEKGEITGPLQDTFWGARFGTLKDQFGINWMFNFEIPKQK
jgi:PhnB protein